jgi:hypothetical protein
MGQKQSYHFLWISGVLGQGLVWWILAWPRRGKQPLLVEQPKVLPGLMVKLGYPDNIYIGTNKAAPDHTYPWTLHLCHHSSDR